MIRVLLLAVALLVSGGAQAHQASDAYLQLLAGKHGLALRWDIALRDLDAAIGLDADEDGRLTWGEVRTAWPRIEAYALSRLRIEGCPLSLASRGLERRGDGAYVTLQLESACVLDAMPPRAPRRWGVCDLAAGVGVRAGRDAASSAAAMGRM